MLWIWWTLISVVFDSLSTTHWVSSAPDATETLPQLIVYGVPSIGGAASTIPDPERIDVVVVVVAGPTTVTRPECNPETREQNTAHGAP